MDSKRVGRASRLATPVEVDRARAGGAGRPPRRVRVERGIYRSPATQRLEIQYTDDRGRIRWRSIDGDLEAARMERAAAQLGYGHPQSPAQRTFAEVAEEWIALQTHLRPRTHMLYRTALDRHLFPRIGTQRIGRIDENVLARVVAELHGEGLSGWTVRGILVPLGRVLSFAVRQKLIADNPLKRLERSERPRVVRREMRILRSSEVDRLLRAAPDGYRAILATAIFTGLRQGELLGLRWADVDFDRGLVHVRRQLDRGGGYSEPKTPKAVRSVMLTPSLAQLLQQHREAARHPAGGDPVFATATGRPMHYRNVTRRGLGVALAASGLDSDGEPRLRFHDLRHTFASLLIAEGLNIMFISRQLGHASPSFTLDVYGGLFDAAEHQRRATEALEAGFATMLSTCSSPESSTAEARVKHALRTAGSEWRPD